MYLCVKIGFLCLYDHRLQLQAKNSDISQRGRIMELALSTSSSIQMCMCEATGAEFSV